MLYAKPSWRRAIRRGIAYDLDVSDFMEWLVYYGIAVEPRDELFGLAQRGYTVLDIGANVGECTLNFAARTGPAGRVLAFEPHPGVRQKLMSNIELNPSIRNIDVFDVGLGDANSTPFLSTPAPRNFGGNRILERPEGDQVSIRVRLLDDVLEERGVDRVDLIKIDVEGFELRVLRGARQTLDRFRPTLFVEVNDDNLRGAGGSADELVRFLTDAGYELRSAEDNAAVRPGAGFAGRHFDVVAVARPA